MNQNENQNELMHYGVPGMKWGKRKAQPVTRTLRPGTKRINAAREAIAKRKNSYLGDTSSDRAFDQTYKKTYNSLIKSGMRKGRASDKALKAATKEGQKVESKLHSAYKKDMKKLKSEYKQAKKEGKKERKQDLKDAYRNVKKSSSLGEKLVFNRATRKLASKYIVDKKMSLDTAKKAANQKAIRNTAIALGAIAVMNIGTIKKAIRK